jgi:hypothetical protein
VLSFSSPEEKRQIENLHKVFAVAAAIPELVPLWKRLLRLPPNDFFYALFRSWYLVCHMTDVMPRRPNWEEMKRSLLSIFGVYRGADAHWYPYPAPRPLPVVDVAAEAAARVQASTGSLISLRRPREKVAPAVEADDVR